MNNITHLLWTGGWDSTFRLLQLLFEKKVKVQPHYIIADGQTASEEIVTMNKIRQHLYHKYPKTRELLRPIIFFDKRRIDHCDEIHNAYIETKKRQPIQLQYETFARYCRQIGADSIELSVLKNETIDFDLANKVIFSHFTYPLVGYTKKKIADLSKRNEWEEIMFMTWFCRRPVNGQPCGFCGPCSDVAEAGLSKRLPWKAKLIAHLQLPLRKFWRDNYHMQSAPIIRSAKKILDRKY